MPPPDPRSSTVSPAFSSINAVGLPQPSEAATAASGRAPRSPSLYRFDVISSVPQQLEPEQQLTSFAPAAALPRRRAVFLLDLLLQAGVGIHDQSSL